MSDPDWNASEVEDESSANNKPGNKGKRTSSVWNHCDLLANNYAMCKLCHQKLSYKSSVTNLRKHFKRKHPGVSVSPNMSNRNSPCTVRRGTSIILHRAPDAPEPALHSGVSVSPNKQFLKNRPIRPRPEVMSSDDDERREVLRAANAVIVDYLGPAGDENRTRVSNSMNNFSRYSQTLKRERSPARFDCQVAAKHSRESKSEETELELFGRTVVMQLKTLPLVHALEVQGEIMNLIFQKRIQGLRQSQETLTEGAPMQYALVYAAPPARHKEVTVDSSKDTEEERVTASS